MTERTSRPSTSVAGDAVDGEAEVPAVHVPEHVEQAPASIGRSFLSWRTLVSFGLAIVIMVFVFRGMDIDLKDAWRQIREANVWLFLGAVAVYYLTFAIRAIRWTGMLHQAGITRERGYPVPGLPGMYQIVLLSWFANSVLPARLGDAYRSYLIKQRANASFGVSFGTIIAERLIDLVVLVTVLLASGLVVFGTHTPDKAEQAFIAGGVVVVVGVIGVTVFWFFRESIERFLPQRIMPHYRKVHDGLFAALGNPLPPALISVVLWMCDGLRVYLVAWSLGQHISFPAGVMVALLSSLVSIIPFTPAGLGFVEGFMVTALTQIGVPASSAAAIALLDRVITYLSLIAVGIPLYLWVLRRDIRTANEDAG
jgi:glycosyltransferase 2 family protein